MEQLPNSQNREDIIRDIIRRIGPSVQINELGQPCILLPLRKKSELPSEYHLGHPRVRSEIAYWLYRARIAVFSPSEINRILSILEGRAWQKYKGQCRWETAIDANPLYEAVHLLLGEPSNSGSFSGPCSKLLNELNQIVLKHGLHIRGTDWPAGTAQLSQRLWKAREILRGTGIEIERGRRGGGARYLCLERRACCDASNTPQQQRHEPNSLNNQDIGHSDACSGGAGDIEGPITTPRTGGFEDG